MIHSASCELPHRPRSCAETPRDYLPVIGRERREGRQFPRCVRCAAKQVCGSEYLTNPEIHFVTGRLRRSRYQAHCVNVRVEKAKFVALDKYDLDRASAKG